MIQIFNDEISNLCNFSKRDSKLEIVIRQKPAGASPFFKQLVKSPFSASGEFRKNNALKDIEKILAATISSDLQKQAFYKVWLDDMASVATLFCKIEKSDSVKVWVGTNRGCSRYHVDNVPRRLLVTYEGKGTEWLPDDAADRAAYTKGKPNELIVKDPSSKQFIGEWDIAVFKGGVGGLLHRTPDEALTSPTVFMRLDNIDFGFG